MKESKTIGVQSHRLKNNPDEKAFAEAWAEFYPPHLGWLLTTGSQIGRAPQTSERDEVVAATVIQWLGSPVGKNFLRELGFVKKEERRCWPEDLQDLKALREEISRLIYQLTSYEEVGFPREDVRSLMAKRLDLLCKLEKSLYIQGIQE